MTPNFLLLFLFLFPLVLLSAKPASAFSVVNLTNYHQIDLPEGVVGPESIAFDCRGRGPYVGVEDGRILKWQGPRHGWTEFAITTANRPKFCGASSNPNTTTNESCGRPLGLKFYRKTCELFIADAYFGLLKTGPNGGQAQQIATSFEGVPFRFLNGLDVDQRTGTVYFTETSMVYQRRDSGLAISTGDSTGRLLKYDPRTKKVSALIKGLAFANGVAVSKDSSFLLVAETTKSKILKLWLRGPKMNDVQLFSQQVRSIDNIKINDMGQFWVALRNRTAGNHTASGPDPVGVKFDEQGHTVEVLDGEGGTILDIVSEVEEHNGNLWIGSVRKPYVGVIKC